MKGNPYMSGCLGKTVKFGLFIVGAFIVLAVIGAILNPSSQRRTTTTSNQVAVVENSSAATTVPPTATPEWMAPSFEEICGNNATMTDIQQEDLAAKMAGKKIVGWTGKVYDVERDGDSYKVQVDIAQGFIKSRQVEILGVTRDVAEKLNVDQVITFDGTIKSVDMFAGDLCNPINVVEATIQ